MQNKFAPAYQRPIFLHAINKEMHDALARDIDFAQLLSVIRTFSVVTSQVMFCNISQVYEVLFDKPQALQELIELEKIGKFVALSDFSSFDEFRESRIRNFPNTISRHPGFTAPPSKTLLRLPFGSLGRDFSTTKFIEGALGGWLEGKDTRLQWQLSESDRRTLRNQEEWIGKTLKSRDQWALTFDAFEATAPRVYSANDEHAIRRALSQVYVDGYEQTYSASSIWGLSGINHFERGELPCGLNFRLARFVLQQTGVDAYLKAKSNYGRSHRSLFEEKAELAYFREGYADFSIALDERLDGVSLWHERAARLRGVAQRIAASELLTVKSPSPTFSDILLISGERLRAASKIVLAGASSLRVTTVAALVEVGGESARSQIVVGKAEAGHGGRKDHREQGPDDINRHLIAEKKASSPPPKVYQTYGFASLLGGVVVAAAAYVAIPYLLELQWGLRSGAALLLGVIGAIVLYYFHPDFWYRRFAFGGLSLIALGGLGINVDLSGDSDLASGGLKLTMQESWVLIIVGCIITVTSLWLDSKSRQINARDKE